MSNATRRSPLCCANTSHSFSNVARPCGGVDRRMATDRRQPLAHHLDRHDLRGHDPRRLVVALELALDEHHAAVVGEVAELLERLGEHHDLEAAAGILEHEDAHAVALARLQRAQARDDAADRQLFDDRGPRVEPLPAAGSRAAPCRGPPPRRRPAPSARDRPSAPAPPSAARRRREDPPRSDRRDARSSRDRATPSRS